MTDASQAKHNLKKQVLLFVCSAVVALAACLILFAVSGYAAPGVSIDVTAGETEGTLGVLEVLVLFALLGLLPSIILMMTSFTRIIIVLSFLRNALGTQQSPPNQVLIGLALFLTFFIMMPVIREVGSTAYDPYKAGTITQEEALERAQKPIKLFMIKETSVKALTLFLTISETDPAILETMQSPEELTELGLEILVPAFITSELEQAFLMGFLIFVPFLIIDMVVSSVLMSMGMVMLPPAMIALPFKLLMFIMVDGWELLLGTLVRGFG